MTKLKNTDEKCECHCHIKRHSCKLDELHLLECSHCNPEKLPCGCPKQDEYSICINQEHLSNPEKQGDWESRFIQEFCNDHNGEIRFLRGVFYDEKDGAEQIVNFIRQLEKQTKLDTARRIAEVAQEAGLVPKDLASATDWKEAVEIIKKQTRESVIEDALKYAVKTVGKKCAKSDFLYQYLLKQKTKE